MNWDVEQIEFIRRNYGKMSASQIGRAMPGKHKFSRLAVIGKAMRLGLGGHKSITFQEVSSSMTAVRTTKYHGAAVLSGIKAVVQHGVLSEPTVISISDLKCEPVSFMDRLPDQCSWPLDDGMYCGLKRLTSWVDKWGRRVAPAYCPTHHQQSIVPSKYVRGIWKDPT